MALIVASVVINISFALEEDTNHMGKKNTNSNPMPHPGEIKLDFCKCCADKTPSNPQFKKFSDCREWIKSRTCDHENIGGTKKCDK